MDSGAVVWYAGENPFSENSMKKTVMMPAIALLLLASVAARAGAADTLPCGEELKRQQETIAALEAEKAALAERIRAMECLPAISSAELLAKNHRQLRELAKNTRAQRQSMVEFEGFVKWMSGSLSGYERYIQAGSMLAGFARVLPIPYAGQASVLTKFVSQGVLSLNATSASIARYLETSRKFLARVDAIDPVKWPTEAQLADATRFADSDFLREMTDVQERLRSAAEISSSTLSFLEAVRHYAGNSDEYWARTKAFITRADAAKADKGYLTTSIEGLRNRAEGFNGKLRLFEETAKKDIPLVKNLVAYDDLLREMEAKAVARK